MPRSLLRGAPPQFDYVGKEWQTQLETAPDIFFLLPSLHEASPLYKTAKGGQGR